MNKINKIFNPIKMDTYNIYSLINNEYKKDLYNSNIEINNLLIITCKLDLVTIFTTIIEYNKNININYDYILMLLLKKDSINIFSYLYDNNKINLFLKDKYNNDIIMILCINNSKKIFNFLIKKNIKLNFDNINKKLDNYITLACKYNNILFIKEFSKFQDNFNINYVDKDGNSALFICYIYNYYLLFLFIFENFKYLNLNLKNNNNSSILTISFINNNFAIFNLLCKDARTNVSHLVNLSSYNSTNKFYNLIYNRKTNISFKNINQKFLFYSADGDIKNMKILMKNKSIKYR